MMCEPGKEDAPLTTQSIPKVEGWTMNRQFQCSVMSITLVVVRIDSRQWTGVWELDTENYQSGSSSDE